MMKPVNRKMLVGFLLVLASYSQALCSHHVFAHPTLFFHGYAYVPGTILGICSALFTLGVIVFAEGVCQACGAPSLWKMAIKSRGSFVRIAAAGAGAGLLMEVFAQWFGKLWTYPYWPAWFYWIILVPGFAFYWFSIVESYLAAKAVLEKLRIQRASKANPTYFGFEPLLYKFLGAIGIVLFLRVLLLEYLWYHAHGGYFFSVQAGFGSAPPYSDIMLTLFGSWFIVEWVMYLRRGASFVHSLLHGYWLPFLAIVCSSVPLSLIMETQNTGHYYWLYAHLPWPGVMLFGVQFSVFVTWPLHYLALLFFPAAFVVPLATLFFRPSTTIKT